ncbi:MAG: hypothetical protein WBP13_00105 [Methylophilaceae bacterium]
MKLIYIVFSFFSFIVLTQTHAHAATYRVDDTATLTGASEVKMHWRSTGANNISGHIIDGATMVTIRLNTAPWLNKVGQIYMVLPPQPIGQVLVDWSTQGKLLSGSLISGNRTLVYAGPILTSIIEDTINVQVHSDGTRFDGAQKLEFYFEIDVQ